MVDFLEEIFSCQFSLGKRSNFHHILHADVGNERRNCHLVLMISGIRMRGAQLRTPSTKLTSADNPCQRGKAATVNWFQAPQVGKESIMQHVGSHNQVYQNNVQQSRLLKHALAQMCLRACYQARFKVKLCGILGALCMGKGALLVRYLCTT